MVVSKNVSRLSEHIISTGGVFQPSTAAQCILLYLTIFILGVSKEGKWQ